MKTIKNPAIDKEIPSSRRVLVLGTDTQVGLWVVRSLGRAGLEVLCVGKNVNGLAAYSKYCKGAWLIERPVKDPEFLKELRDLALEFKAGSIMTIAENYHLALIENRSLFEPEIHLFSPEKECFQKATDKDFLHNLAGELNIPVAKGTTLDRLMDQGADKTILNYPLVLRARQQSGEKAEKLFPWKAAYAETESQLADIYKEVKDIAANVIVQEYHAGVEIHVHVLMHNDEPFMVGEYIGEHHMPLAGGVTVLRKTCRHEQIINDAINLLKAINWKGIATVQFHYDVNTGNYIFLEINPRYCGGQPTVIMAGFDAGYLLWQTHFEPEKMRRSEYRLGMRTRVLGGDINWLLSMIGGGKLPPGEKRLSRFKAISSFLWHFGPWTRDDVFTFTDPKPMWIDLKQMALGFLKRG